MKHERYWHLYYDNLYRMIVPHYKERVVFSGGEGIVYGGDENGCTVGIEGSNKYMFLRWSEVTVDNLPCDRCGEKVITERHEVWSPEEGTRTENLCERCL